MKGKLEESQCSKSEKEHYIEKLKEENFRLEVLSRYEGGYLGI